MLNKPSLSQDEAQIIALKALAFLASDASRISRFMGLTGTAPETIRSHASMPGFLGGVLDYLCGDQTLLLAFAESDGVEPALIEAASRCLAEA